MEIDDVSPASSDGVKKKVAYFYDAEVGNYHYGQGHPMKVRLDDCFVYGFNNTFDFLPNPVLEPFPLSHYMHVASSCTNDAQFDCQLWIV